MMFHLYTKLYITINQFHSQKVHPEIKKAHYFSHGCAGQCKYKKHFLNLCIHKIEFNVDCVWNVFATSHGTL